MKRSVCFIGTLHRSLSYSISSPYSYRFFASQAQKGPWSALSTAEQAAWKALWYDEDSWEGRRSAPKWKEWSELSLEERGVAMYGLSIQTKEEWDKAAPSQRNLGHASRHGIPPLSVLLEEESDNDDHGSSSRALVVAQETRLQRQQQASSLGGSIGKFAYQTVKGLAPLVGPLVRSAASQSRGRGAVGLSVAGSLIEGVPTMMDMYSGVLNVTGIDTLIYLDDSGSMKGANLIEGQKALQSLETRLKTNSNDQRFLPTRIVKFGNHSTVLNPSEEDWSPALVNVAWDGSSGGTFMWKMIQDDVQAKYRPAGGKLRIVVITDGYDNWSPPPYNGVRGFDPLMRTLLNQGYDIEWNIIVVGNDLGVGLFRQPELTKRDQELYKNLCHATGGQFLSLGAAGWNENDYQVEKFLDAVEDSGYHDSQSDRRERQEQYKLEARRGKAENFDWLPALPDKDDDD